MRRDYGPDVLAEGAGRRRRAEYPQVAAERGLVVEEAGGGFCGAVVECEKQVVTLEDRVGRQRVFPLTRGGFLLEGRPVTLVGPGLPRPDQRDRPAFQQEAAAREGEHALPAHAVLQRHNLLLALHHGPAEAAAGLLDDESAF